MSLGITIILKITKMLESRNNKGYLVKLEYRDT